MVPTLSSPLLFTVRVALIAVVLLAGCAAPASSLSADEAFGRDGEERERIPAELREAGRHIAGRLLEALVRQGHHAQAHAEPA